MVNGSGWTTDSNLESRMQSLDGSPPDAADLSGDRDTGLTDALPAGKGDLAADAPSTPNVAGVQPNRLVASLLGWWRRIPEGIRDIIWPAVISTPEEDVVERVRGDASRRRPRCR